MAIDLRVRTSSFAVLLVAGTALAGLPLAGPAKAQTVWTGASSANWTVNGNWSTATAPTAANDVVIDNNTPGPVLSGAAGHGNFIVVGKAATATLTVNNAGALDSQGLSLGQLAGSTGTLTVDGAGSTLTNNQINVGDSGHGILKIQNAGALHGGQILSIANQPGSVGSMTITGAGSTATAQDVQIGDGGAGTLLIQAGGALTSSYADIGGSGSAAVSIDGAHSSWTNSGVFSLGSPGVSGLIVSNGGALNNAGVATIDGAAGTTSLTVTGPQSSWVNKGDIQVGLFNHGALSISGGGGVKGQNTDIGAGAGADGTVTIDGAGSILTDVAATTVGYDGTGILTVSHGGVAASADVQLGLNTHGKGTVVIDGIGSQLTATGAVEIGSHGAGDLTIASGATVSDVEALIGNDVGGVGVARISGAGSTWTTSDQLVVGGSGTGTLNLSSGAVMDGDMVYVGEYAGSTGHLVVDGGTSSLTAGALSVGGSGTGDLTIQNGGRVIDATATVGEDTTAIAGVTVTGQDSAWLTTGQLNIGGRAGATLVNVQAGGTVLAQDISLGYGATDSGGAVVVDGVGSSLAATDGFLVGDSGAASLTVNHGASLGTSTGSIILGNQAGSNAVGTVSGVGSTLAANNLVVGQAGMASLTLLNGATATSNAGFVGVQGSGSVTVTGAGSRWDANGFFIGGESQVAGAGTGTLAITGGGAVGSSSIFEIGQALNSSGSVRVQDAGSSLTVSSSDLVVGDVGSGQLAITAGGVVTAPILASAIDANATGATMVDGVGSRLTLSQASVVGFDGAGSLTVSNGGAVVSSADLSLAAEAGSIGTLNIGAGAADPAAAAGSFTAPSVTLGAGAGSIIFNHTSANYDFAAAIGGASGVIRQVSGVTNLTGDSSGFNGLTQVNGGTLRVNGALGTGNVVIAAGGTLGGTGVIGGSATVTGTLVGAQGASLTLGNLTLNHSASTNVTLTAPAGGALFHVTHNLSLDGTLNVATPGVFGAGIYRLFDYGGALSGPGLTIGATPANSSLSVQTSVAGQVNLLDLSTAPSTYLFWDGGAAGHANNHAIDGGAGAWSASAPNWTDSAGAVNAAMAPQPGFGVFQGMGGVVTLDASAGPVTATGLQFAANGYRLAGAPLGLAGSSPIIRVGDGTALGAGYTATIDSVLTGTAGLTTTDLGTLVLNGANTYSGGTIISSGTLVGSATSFGTGAIADNATLVVDQGASANFANVVSGGGALIKRGVGALTLTGADTLSGLTTVEAGRLDVNGALTQAPVLVNSGAVLGGSGSIGGAVTVNGTLAGLQGQSLTLESLALGHGSTTNVSLTSPGGAVLFHVTHNLSLDGTLNVTAPGAFGAGVYRLIDYGGALSGPGLAIGAAPAGAILAVQTSVAGQVNLVDSLPAALTFWDGGRAGSANNHAIDGGGGLWSRTAANWTDSAGATNGVMTPQPGFAVFQGAGGTVTIDAASGPVSATGLQFAANGYRVTGAALGLAGSAPTIRVGDGTAGGAAYTAVVDSVLTGTAGLTTTDLGTLILNGANTYSGGTTIGGGTLVGSATSFGTGAIADNATLVIDQPADAAFANVLTGTGALKKRGAGSLNLTGVSALSGSVSVEAGRLAVNGSLSQAQVVVASGATLGGNGAVGRIHALAGSTIAPGNSIGVLTVAGPVNFDAGSTYQVEADAAGHADKITATGPATLSGGSVQVMAAAGVYAPATRYTILTAAGVSGTFASVSSNLAFLTPNLSYDANDVYLNLLRNSTSFQSVGQTRNQIATGGAVATLPNGNSVFDAVVQLDAPSARASFDALSGEIHASTSAALIEDSRFLRQAVLNRLNAPAKGDGAAVWGQVLNSSGSSRSDGNAGRLTRALDGAMAGADMRLSAAWRIGGVAGYSRTRLDVADRASAATSDNLEAGLFAGGQWGGLALRLGAAYGAHDIDTRRSAGFTGFAGALGSHHQARSGQVFGELGYAIDAELGWGQARFEPLADLARVNLTAKGFDEAQGPAALNVQHQSDGVTYGGIGARETINLTLNQAKVSLWGAAMLRRTTGDLTPEAVMAFGNSATFTVAGLPIARQVQTVDIGAEVALQNGLRVSLGYSGEWTSGLHDRTIKANLDWRF